MEKIVISNEEVLTTPEPSVAAAAAGLTPRVNATPLAPSIPLWARIALAPLVLVLPLLCLVAVILRVAMRNLIPRVRFAWASYLNTLLIVSGLLTSIATVVSITTGPTPAMLSQGLSDLDDRAKFPSLPSANPLTPQEASEQLKPLVFVISPAAHGWFSNKEMPSNGLGAGILLQANQDGYLIATARHVIGADGDQPVVVTTASGVWSSARLIARHSRIDMSLIWLKRNSGSSSFLMPIDTSQDVKDGDAIYVIGHPHDLRYTLSMGIVSRADKGVFQISAPVSPGNSGGPMFDNRGRLAGIVVSMFDKNRDANAENLNFAVRAETLLDLAGWDFYGDGRQRLADFIGARKK